MRLPRDRAAVPCRLAEVGGRRFRQALARLIGGETFLQLAAHQQPDGKLDAGPPVVGIERQRPPETADGLVEAAEIAQAERQIEEAFGVIPVERDRLEMMFYRLVKAIGGTQCIAEIGMERGIVGVGGERQPVVRDRRIELADQPKRHAEIVVQLGVIGPDRQQPQIPKRSPRRVGPNDGPAPPAAAAGRSCRLRCRTAASAGWRPLIPASSGGWSATRSRRITRVVVSRSYIKKSQ